MEGYTSVYHPAHIGSAEAWDLANSGGAVVLDLRSDASYLERHVSSAVNVPFEGVADYAASSLPDKDAVIICYCFCGDKGGTALSAYELLTGLGYTRVFYTEPDAEWSYAGTAVAESGTADGVVSGARAKELFDSNAGAILLDVRNQDEYDAGHIEGSMLIPASELEARLSELPDKDAVIIVYCKAGVRSAGAYDTLIAHGYASVYDMQSVEAWPEAPVTK